MPGAGKVYVSVSAMSASEDEYKTEEQDQQTKVGAEGAERRREAGARGRLEADLMSRLTMVDDEEEKEEEKKMPHDKEESFHSASDGERGDGPVQRVGKGSKNRSEKVGDRSLPRGKLSLRPETGSKSREPSRERPRTPDTASNSGDKSKPRKSKRATKSKRAGHEKKQDEPATRSLTEVERVCKPLVTGRTWSHAAKPRRCTRSYASRLGAARRRRA
jgi:hypothetical protein